MSRFRFTTVQLFLITALCGLLAGLVAEVDRQGRHRWISGLAYSPDGRYIVATYAMGGARIWNLDSARPLPRNLFVDQFYSSWTESNVCFVGDTTIANVQFDGNKNQSEIVVWDIVQNSATRRIALSYPPTTAVFSSAGIAVTGLSGTGKFEIWNLHTGIRVGSIAPTKLPARTWIVGAAISADGRRFAFDTPATKAEVWDLESQSLMFSFDVEQGRHMVFSHDGKWLALSDGGMKEVWNSETQERCLRKLAENRWISFARDGKSVVSVNRDVDIEVIEATDYQPIAKITRPERYHDGFINLHEPNLLPISIAYSPDGQVIAACDDEQLTLYKTHDHSTARVLQPRNRMIPAVMFGVGFFVWSILWGRWSRREQARGEAELKDQPDLDVSPPLPKNIKHAVNPQGALLRVSAIFSGLSVLCAIGGADNIAFRWGINYWLAFSIFVVGTFIAWWIVVFILLLLTRLFVLPFTGRHKYQINRAEKIAGRDPYRVDFGPVTARFFGTSALEATIEREFDDARRRYETLIGQKLDLANRPLLILCFEHQQMMDEFFRGHIPVGGVFVPYRERVAVVCEQASLDYMTEPTEILRNLLAYHFFHCQKGFLAPSWVSACLAWVLQGSPEALRRAHRRLRVAGDTDTTNPNPLPLFSTNGREILKLTTQRDELENARKLSIVLSQCLSMAEFLRSQHPEALCAFLHELQNRSDVNALFQRHFKCDYSQITDAWQAWVDRQPIDFEPMPPIVHRHLSNHVLPIVRDKKQPLDARRKAIHSMSAGYLTGADTLIEVLRDGDQRLQMDAAWALESIAGESYGRDATRWQAWWDGRSEDFKESKSADDQTVVARSIDAAFHHAKNDPVNQLQTPDWTNETRRVPPPCFRACWALIGVSGAFAIALSMMIMFSRSFYWEPWLGLVSLVGGVFAVTIVAGQVTRYLRTAACLQIVSLLNCNVINLVFGMVVLLILRRKDARQHLQTIGSWRDRFR